MDRPTLLLRSFSHPRIYAKNEPYGSGGGDLQELRVKVKTVGTGREIGICLGD